MDMPNIGAVDVQRRVVQVLKTQASRTDRSQHTATLPTGEEYVASRNVADSLPKTPTTGRKRKARNDQTMRSQRPHLDNQQHPVESCDILGFARSSKFTPTPPLVRQPGLLELQKHDSRYSGLLLQPASRPISQEQLVAEVKSIYAGLTMVETKCIHVDRAQAAAPNNATQKLARDHWQALIALHRTLVHEHQDFSLGFHHPSASPALRRLASEYNAMPSCTWKHGAHVFLEILRQSLPHSQHYMLAFVYLADQMTVLLSDFVPASEDTWIECPGDSGRYRMAIEDKPGDFRDRETWAGVARPWYSKAAVPKPTLGHLYQHLAMLACSNALKQVCYYHRRGLSSMGLFPSARESVITLFDSPIKQNHLESGLPSILPVDSSLIEAHAFAFARGSVDRFEASSQDYLNQLDNHIGRVTAKWKEQGVYTAVMNIAGWFDYDVGPNPLQQLFLLRAKRNGSLCEVGQYQELSISSCGGLTKLYNRWGPSRNLIGPSSHLRSPGQGVQDRRLGSCLDPLPGYDAAEELTIDTFASILRRIGDIDVLPHLHVILSLLAPVGRISDWLSPVPWSEMVSFFCTLVKAEQQEVFSLHTEDLNMFPSTEGGEGYCVSLFTENYMLHDLSGGRGEGPPIDPFRSQNAMYGRRMRRFIGRLRAMLYQQGSLDLGLLLSVASLPRVLAYEATSPPPELLLRKAEIFDYICYGLMFPSMSFLWWLGPKTMDISFTAMLLFAFFWFAATNTSSLLEIRTTIAQIWVVFGINYVLRDCVQATHSRLHLLRYTVLSALFATIGTAMQSPENDKLKVIPPAVTVAAIVLSFIPEDYQAYHPLARDVERALPHLDVELERVVVERAQ